MNIPIPKRQLSETEHARSERCWKEAFEASSGAAKRVVNRSGIGVKPLYTPNNWADSGYLESLGFPGEYPFTRGIYPSMHRGRSWSQRQLVGFGMPEDYNARLKEMLGQGANAISMVVCNSVYRGYDADEAPAELLGTCGTVINTVEHMERALEGVPIERISCGINDPAPFTVFAMLLAVAKRRGIPWTRITGTSNQSDCLSHFVALHMFVRTMLSGTRRIVLDHIEFCNERVPGWNPMSVIGQHMEQAGATPAQGMAFTLCSAIQFGEDCIARGMDPDRFLPRFTFFFDISLSFFEEVAKFRAGRRIWARITRERLGAKDPRSWRFKFHAQTSGVDLTRQQPLNNIARTTAQAMAGIFGGLQSLHTDGYDEALSAPTVESARIAVATQNILREEAGLCDVIDPLGGSYYVEALTDRMQEEIESIMAQIEAAGGMYQAVEQGLVQRMIGESAAAFQRKVESGEQTVVGVNAYRVEENPEEYKVLEYPQPERMEAFVAQLREYKARRSNEAVRKALDELARAAQGEENTMVRIVEAIEAGVTHGEVCATLRRELGFGRPITVI